MKLVNNATQQLEEVPDHQVADAFQSGKYGFQAGQAIPTKAPDGSFGTVPAEHIQEFLSGGGQIAQAHEYRQAELEQKHGGVLGTAAAGLEGLARGVSVGTSDPAAVWGARVLGGRQAEKDVRTHLEEEKEAHPWVSTGSELLGAAAPILLSDGAAAPEEAGVIAKTAKATFPSLISGAGESAERVANLVLGDAAKSTLGRAGQAAVRQATRSIVEGGLFGAGQEISQSTLEDTPLTAEKMLSAVGHSALTSGVLGLGLGGAGKLAGEGLTKAVGSFAPALEDATGTQTWKWLNPGKKLAEKAEKQAGGTASVGQTVFDDVLRPYAQERGMAAVGKLTDEDKLELVRQAKESAGQAIGQHIEDNEGTRVALKDMLAPIRRMRQEFAGVVMGEDKVAAMDRLEGSVMQKLGHPVEEAAEAAAPAARRARSGAEIGQYMREHPELTFGPGGEIPEEAQFETKAAAPKAPRALPEDAQVPIKDAITQRRALQQIAYEESKALDPKMRVQLLRQVSREWGDLEESALNQATKDAAGTPAGDQLKALNQRYQHLSIAEDALETSTARHAANRNLSLSDYLMGAAHAPSLLLTGHPLGAATAVASSLGHHFLREHGNAYAALMIDRLSSAAEASRAAALADKVIDGSVESLVSGRRTTLPRAFHVKLSDYEDEESRVRQLAAMAPGIMGAHLSQVTAPMTANFPQAGQQMQALATKATGYLADKLPALPQVTTDGAPATGSPPISDAQKTAFLRSVRAVEEGPSGMMQRLAAGHIVPEDIEAMQAIYQNSLAEIQQRVNVQMAESKKAIPYQNRVILSELLKQPLDASMSPEFSAAVDAVYAPKPAQQEPPPGLGPGNKGGRRPTPPKELGSSVATAFESAGKSEAA